MDAQVTSPTPTNYRHAQKLQPVEKPPKILLTQTSSPTVETVRIETAQVPFSTGWAVGSDGSVTAMPCHGYFASLTNSGHSGLYGMSRRNIFSRSRGKKT